MIFKKYGRKKWGIDRLIIPEINILRTTIPKRTYAQIIGRSLRPKPKKIIKDMAKLEKQWRKRAWLIMG